ncbi:signal peptidase I [Fusibacter sp. JL298sf-3]
MDKLKKELIEWGQAILVTVIIFMIYNYFFATTTVYNTSMYPTIQEKDMLFMTKIGEMAHGDIASYKSELTLSAKDYNDLNFIQKIMHKEGERKNLIKRVIAVPGDYIEVRDGVVYLNDKALDEPYVSSYITGTVERQQVPEGKYFMMGDNRSYSQDSRSLGFVDEEDFIGKVLFRFLPIKRVGAVN